MAADDVRVICFDPAADTNLRRATVFTRIMRKGFKYSHAAPVGNVSASWTVDCDHLADVGFPKGKARILVDDPVRGTYLWRGVLQKPRLHYERGRLSSATFTAVGCAEGSWRQFPDPIVFGAETFLPTVGPTYRQLVTNLGEAVSYGLSITPLIDGTQAGIADGPAPTEDTRDYRGSTAPQLWEDMCNLTRGYGTPFTWMVEPDDSGLAALSFFAESPNPVYWEHGNAKSNDLEVDYSQIANLIYVVFQGRVIQVPAPGDPLDYSATPDDQTAFINLSDMIREYDVAAGFAENLYNKWNQRVITGGQIVLDRDIRARGPGSTFQMIPCHEVRAGRGIQVEITKTPYLPGVALDIIIKSAEYDEDACTMTLAPAILTEEGKQARILTIRGEQAQSKTTWAWTDRNMASPILNLGAGSPAAPIPFGTPSTTPVSRRENNRTTYNPATGLPLTSEPNSTPPAYNTPLPAGAREWIIEHSAPIVALARQGMAGLGTWGRKIHPQELPDQRLNIPAQFGTADPLTGALTDGERMHTDVQEGWFDTITVSVLGGTAATVDVHVDVYNWDDEAIRLVDAFTAVLTGLSSRFRLQYDNSDNDHRPVLLYHGDQLIWRVVGAVDDVILNCAISGDKFWHEFPPLVGPDWIPGNG